MTMHCDQVFDLIADLLDGTVEPEVEVEALEHLATCARCETTLAETRALVDLAPEARPVTLAPDQRAAIRSRLLDALTEDP
jgi:anti-sigma factor RsiW